MAIFGKKVENRSEDWWKVYVASIIVVNTGSVMVAHRKEAGRLSFLCHHGEPVVWSGVVKGTVFIKQKLFVNYLFLIFLLICIMVPTFMNATQYISQSFACFPVQDFQLVLS